MFFLFLAAASLSFSGASIDTASAASGPSEPVPEPLVRAVRFEGLHHTVSATVQREIEARPGQACDAACQQADLDRLDRLGAFAGVSVSRTGDTLVYRLIELPLVVPVPNGRISDEEGLSLGAGLKAPNLFGRAVAGEFLFLLGHSTEWQLNMGAPRLGSVPLGWELFTSRTDRWDEGRGYKEVSYTSRAAFTGPTDGRLQALAAISMVQVRADRDGIALSRDRRDAIPMVRLGALWDGRDRTSLTRCGLYQEWSVEKAGKPLNGPVDSWEFLSDSRAWVPVSATWGLHASHLMQVQTGRVGGWKTYVLGGANTVRGLPGNWATAPSEEIGTLEVRWLAVAPRPVDLWGANLFYGLQLIGGADVGVAWKDEWGERRGMGVFTGADLVVPFLERVRFVGAVSPNEGWRLGFAVGLFEKTVIERYRVR